MLNFTLRMHVNDLNNSKTATQSKHLRTDNAFKRLFPDEIALIAERHWTPLHVARQAAEFLCISPGSRILYIGSGVGKFCLAAAAEKPSCIFTGVEQRPELVAHALLAKTRLSLPNVSFIQANFIDIPLADYDHFYFFNPFFENIDDTDRIDQRINYSDSLYSRYVQHLYTFLKARPAGTRLATYHTFKDEIPREYNLVSSLADSELNFWIKK